MKRQILVGLVLSSYFAGQPGAWAETELSTRTARAIVYKDGYVMVTKEVTGTVGPDGRGVLKELPENVGLGEFWLEPGEGNPGEPTAVARNRYRQKPGGQINTSKEIVLQFPNVKEARTAVKLDWEYYRPGIRWIPTYRLTLGRDGKARLRMQAEILNEMEDLDEVPLELVVGVPNFRFRDIVSPMILQAVVNNPLVAVARAMSNDFNGMMNNVQMFSNQRMSESRGGRRDEGAPAPAGMAEGVPPVPPELTGTAGGAQDMFVYKLPPLTLDIGERAMVPVLSAEIPYRHFYTWDVAIQRSGSVAAGNSPMKILKNEIWHQIELTNTTNLPFTTGAALVLDGRQPIAQDLLTYTSVGGKVQMPLAIAVDVRGSSIDEILERTPNAMIWEHNAYYRILAKGTLKVTNYKKEAITLLLQADFGGTCTETTDQGEFRVSAFSGADWENCTAHPALNSHSTVVWELELKPGETKEVSCKYYYFLR